MKNENKILKHDFLQIIKDSNNLFIHKFSSEEEFYKEAERILYDHYILYKTYGGNKLDKIIIELSKEYDLRCFQILINDFLKSIK